VRNAQHGDASVLAWWEPKYIGEIEVERDECPSFDPARFDQFFVTSTAEVLTGNGCYVVTGCQEEIYCPVAQVFVELCFQAGRSRGTSTNRSRLISAP